MSKVCDAILSDDEDDLVQDEEEVEQASSRAEKVEKEEVDDTDDEEDEEDVDEEEEEDEGEEGDEFKCDDPKPVQVRSQKFLFQNLDMIRFPKKI